MTYPKRRHALIVQLLVAGLAIHFVAGQVSWYGVPALLTITIAISLLPGAQRKTKAAPPSVPNETREEQILPRLIQREVNGKASVVTASALGSAYRRSERQKIEEVVDAILDRCIALVRARLDVHTVAVFFPSGDSGLKLRRYHSLSDYINKDAVIYPGLGVIGGFLKDGLKQLNLQEIVSDSMTLYYYNKDAGIRSLMASPIVAGGSERGTIIVDSTDKKHFSDDDHAYLSSAANLLGQAVYYAYLCTEHHLEHVRLAAMSSIEKEFFRDLSIDSILDKIVEIVPFAISCDRLTISMKSEDGRAATIVRAWGMQLEGLQKREFSLKDKSLTALVYAKNISFFRNFSSEHYEVRYFDAEPPSCELQSFVAIPIGVDDCKGTILVESTRRDAFSDSSRDLLMRIATSSGLAIEKILIFEKAKNMATHDGLTGLFNHRQFQTILKDEITRSIRFNDQLAVVICDIDHFKKINDTYGHPFGDTVLKGVAARLESSIRQGVDTAARYGGEEFALVLVKTDQTSAAETAERIRQQVASIGFRAPGGQDVHVTMSFGIALYRQHARQLEDLIKKADKALYRAKEGGRNRVEVF